ncbi:MAG: hypothetical protein R2939_10575 [Kofleriaceae bacterium]
MRRGTFALLLVGAGLGGCLDAELRTCDELVCGAGTACRHLDGVATCVPDELITACAGRADGEECESAGGALGTCLDGVCAVIACGNGRVDAGERCDDGNRLAGDGCAADCRSDEVCGNGVTDYTMDEGCDCGTDPDALPPGCPAPNGEGDDAICRSDCSPAGCGDGLILAPEECEPGDGDVAPQLGGLDCEALGYYGGVLGCRSTCRFDTSACEGICGDGVLEGPEDCEPALDEVPVQLGGATCSDVGYYGGTLGCNASCRFDVLACEGRCGDGVVDPVEQCDGTPSPIGCGDLGALIDRPPCSVACYAEATACQDATLVTLAPASTLPNLGGPSGAGFRWIAPDDGSRWGKATSKVVQVDDAGEVAHQLSAYVMDVEVVSSTEVYALTWFGEVQRWDGASWTVVRAATRATADESGGLVSTPDGLVASDLDALAYLTPAGWTPLPSFGTTIADVAYCDGALYALGYGVVGRLDGDLWAEAAGPYLWSPPKLACDEDGGALWVGSYDYVARIDLATLAVTPLPLADANTATYEPFAIGDGRAVFLGHRWQDHVWSGRVLGTLSARHYPPAGTYYGGYPSADGVATFVEANGRVRRADLLVIDHGSPDAFAVVERALWEVIGTSLLRNDTVIATVTAGSKVWANDAERAFVTTGNTVRRCDLMGCDPAVTTPTNQSTSQIEVVSAELAYMSDSSSNMSRWNGTTWTFLGFGLRPFVRVGPDHFVGLNSVGAIREVVDGVVTTVCGPPTCGNNQLAGIGGTWPDAMFAVGGLGRIVARDPATGVWSRVNHDLTEEGLFRVVLVGDRRLVLGTNDTVLQHDAHGWMRADLGDLDSGLTALGGTSSDELWVRGSHGLTEVVLR